MQNKEKYRFLVENIPDVVWTVDQNGNTTFISPRVENVCGYAPEEIYVAGDCFWLDSTNPEDIEKVKAACESLFKSNKMFDIEYRIRGKVGNWIWIHDRALTTYKNGGVIYADGVFTDITERKRAEEEINLLLTIIKSIAEAKDCNAALDIVVRKVCEATGWIYGEVWCPSPDGKYLECRLTWHDSSGNLEEFSKKSKEFTFPPGIGMPGRVWSSKKPEWRKEATIDGDFPRADIVKESGLRAAMGIPVIAKDKVIAVLGFFVRIQRNEDEHLIGFVSSVATQLGVAIERKQAEEMLKESEQRFKSIFENAPDGMLVADTKTKGFYLGNEVICRMLGYKKEEIKHLGVMDIHSKEDLPYVIEQFGKQARGEITLARNIPVKRKDGSIFYADINTILLPLDGKTYMMGIFRDITEQKCMEEEQAKLRDQLYHAQKLASVGKLAGGVAHNFNNLLTVVMGYASLLLAKLKEGDPLREYAQKVISSSQVAANLTQDILAFSRQKPVNPQPVNMNEIIKDTEGILSRLIRENIKLKTALTDKDCIVMADSDQIKQVLMNLATNAMDAMPNEGELNICTDVVEIDKTFIKAHGFGKVGKYVLISFSDTGMGMDENIRLRIFDPFFTTKEVGKGTGLGLAIVYGLVKQHNGYIDVDSAPGKGATFKIYLPQLTNNEEMRKETPYIPAVSLFPEIENT